MKKKVIQINFSNKVFYTLILILGIVVFGGIVFATLQTAPTYGHSVSELQKCGANEVLKMNSAGTTWECATSPLIISNMYTAFVTCTESCTKTTLMGSHSFCALTTIENAIVDSHDSSDDDLNACQITFNPSSGIWNLIAYYDADANGDSASTSKFGHTNCQAYCID